MKAVLRDDLITRLVSRAYAIHLTARTTYDAATSAILLEAAIALDVDTFKRDPQQMFNGLLGIRSWKESTT